MTASIAASADTSVQSAARQWWLMRILPVTIIVCFCGIEHAWQASQVAAAVTGEEYDGTENTTADRLESVDAGSSSWRLLLAAVGGICLILPTQNRVSASSPVTWLVASFVGWLGLSLLWSANPPHTLFKLVVLGVFGVAALGFSRQLTSRQLGIVFGLCSAAFIVIGVVAEILQGTFLHADDYRFTGTTHPNTQACFSAVVCLTAELFQRPNRSRLPVLGLWGLGFFGLLAAKSRTSMLAVLTGLFILRILKARGEKRLVLVAGALMVVAAGLFVTTSLGARAQGQLGGVVSMGRDDDTAELTGRLPLWLFLRDSIVKSPLVGHGYLAYWDADQVEYLSDHFAWEIPHGHNMYLDIMLDGGLVALTLFVSLLLVALTISAYRFVFQDDNGAAFTCSLIVFALIHGFGESLLKLPNFSAFVLYTMILRLVWTLRQDNRRTAVYRSVSPASHDTAMAH